MSDDLYAILGVAANATPDQIEAAYRTLARQYHPDVNRAPEAADRMRDINAAYRVLRDPQRRAEYDRTRLLTQRAAAPERRAEWQDFAAFEARRPPPPTAPPTASAPRVSMPLIVGGVLVLLLASLALVALGGRGGDTGPASATLAAGGGGAGPARSATPVRAGQPTATGPAVILAATGPTATLPPAVSSTPRSSATPSITPTPTETATETPTPTDTPTVAPPRPVGPPLAVTAGEFYNEQETRAGGRKFQIKLNILNQGPQTLNPPWRPRFLVYAGERPKGWVEANYYGPEAGGVDISQQQPLPPGQQQTWAWYTITAGPDEWVRQIEFSALGTRWTWTFDPAFQNAQLSIGR
ncbi:MAG: J domain-containing protein [Anaerolineae bacterium]|nr:J domain-containing protein [Anaerolineae bacterium]